jgi:hypothetical protein
MAALPPFSDSPLTSPQIDTNYTWRQIRQTGSRVDDKIFTNFDTNAIVAPNLGNNFDPAAPSLSVLGHGNTNSSGASESIIIGVGSVIDGGNQSVSIGSGNVLGAGANGTQNNIAVGSGINIGNAAQSVQNISMGNEADVSNGQRNIVLGHLPGTGGVHSDCILIGGGGVGNPRSNGSIILGGGGAGAPIVHSAISRFELSGANLTNLQGDAAANAFDNAATFPIPEINGYMRIKYKDRVLLIPAILDPDDVTNAPVPLPNP